MGLLRVAFAALIVFVFSMLAAAPASADHDTYGVAEYGYGEGLFSTLETPLAIPGSQESAPVTAGAGGNSDINSDNFRLLDQEPLKIRKGRFAEGSDLAFQGRKIIAGTYQGLGIYKRKKRSIKQISFYRCPAAQGDVVVSGDYAFVSIDSRGSNELESRRCNNTPTDKSGSSVGKEGLRVVDISNKRKPRQVGFIETECGSHTQTLVPGAQRSYIYVQSYPLSPTDTECTEADHPEGEISVISFPTDHPPRA
ncbi:MAG: hypothetical protein WKF62_01610, partial [Solirubrobacterales bacterium]